MCQSEFGRKESPLQQQWPVSEAQWRCKCWLYCQPKRLIRELNSEPKLNSGQIATSCLHWLTAVNTLGVPFLLITVTNSNSTEKHLRLG